MKQSSHIVKKYFKNTKKKLTAFAHFIHHFSTVILIGFVGYLGFFFWTSIGLARNITASESRYI